MADHSSNEMVVDGRGRSSSVAATGKRAGDKSTHKKSQFAHNDLGRKNLEVLAPLSE
jgi:hypothetical protein